MANYLKAAWLAATCIAVAPAARACTSIALAAGGEQVVGWNYDFYYGHGAVFVNTSGLREEALSEPKHTPARWTARHASVVFSQFGRELPSAGMNSRGLTVMMLWNLDGAFGAPPPTRGTVNELQWIQYQLDRHSNVAEVVAELGRVAIAKSYAELHYVVCDAAGECALIEFSENGAQVHRGDRYRPAAITNNSLARSQAHFAQYRGRPLDAIPKKRESLAVYARAAWLAEGTSRLAQDPAGRAQALFGALGQVKQDYELLDTVRWMFSATPPSVTHWTVVFSPTQRRIEWHTRGNPRRRVIDVNAVVRRCPAPALTMDVESGDGDAAVLLRPYRPQDNERIVTLSYKPIEREFPLDAQKELIGYPESFTCAAAAD